MKPLLDDIWGLVIDLLPGKDVFNLQLVNKQLFHLSQAVIKQKSSEIIQRPCNHSKAWISQNIHLILDLACRDILPTIHQQLWALERVILVHYTNPEFLEIIKLKFTLIPEMYHVCIRLIQEAKEGSRLLAAEFLQFLNWNGITLYNLPEPIHGKSIQEIIAIWFPVNELASKDFCEQICIGNIELCKQLILQYGGHISMNSDSALVDVVKSDDGTIEEFRWLLEQPGIDVNQVYENCNETALHESIEIDASYRHLFVEALLDCPGIDVNAPQGYNTSTPLMAALFTYGPPDQNQALLNILLQYPHIDVNGADEDGTTALIAASEDGPNYMVEMLLHHPNIDVNRAMITTGDTALTWATTMDNLDAVELLLKHPKIDVNLANNKGKTAMMIASELGRMEIVRLLLQHPRIEFDPVLLSTYAKNEVLSYLLSLPGNILSQLVKKGYGDQALMNASSRGDVGFAKMLLDQPAGMLNLNYKNDNGDCALIMACENGHGDVVTLLLEHPEMDVNLENKEGNTAIMMALKRSFHRIDIIEMLLQHPAIDINDRTKPYGTLAFVKACKQGHLATIKLLLEHPRIMRFTFQTLVGIWHLRKKLRIDKWIWMMLNILLTIVASYVCLDSVCRVTQNCMLTGVTREINRENIAQVKRCAGLYMLFDM